MAVAIVPTSQRNRLSRTTTCLQSQSMSQTHTCCPIEIKINPTVYRIITIVMVRQPTSTAKITPLIREIGAKEAVEQFKTILLSR